MDSFIFNNPITNAIDFIGHGQKQTSTGNIENQFSNNQSGSLSDSQNLALSGFSTQSDMLTSAYFNAEVGDLRALLAAYQVKTFNDRQGNCSHRAVFLGGRNYRDGNSVVDIDVNVGNYPIDVEDNNTNTGRSWKQGLGIPNIRLKGSTFFEKLPIYPLTLQNPSFKNKPFPVGSLSRYESTTSLIDIIEMLKTLFGLNILNVNIDGNFGYDSEGIGKDLTRLVTYPSLSNTNTKLITPAYVSFTSAVTQWVRILEIRISIGETISQELITNLFHSDGTQAQALFASKLKVELVVDGSYCPRQIIGNGTSHQQLFVWLEGKHGIPTDVSTQIHSSLQFGFSNFLVYSLNSTQYLPLFKVSDKVIRVPKILRDSMGGDTPPKKDEYLFVGINPGEIKRDYYYKLASDAISVNNNTQWELELVEIYDHESGEDHNIKIVTESMIKICGCKRFNIDDIRDRYCMLQLIAHIGLIYRTSTGLSLPLKLVEYMSQVRADNNLTLLLYYLSLCEMFIGGDTKTVDYGKTLHQMFDFIENDNYYYNYSEGGNYGIALRYWDDASDCVVTGESSRFTCLNTDETIIYPEDWNPNASPPSSASGYSPSIKTLRMNKVKHIVATNLPGFSNGRYGTSMTPSNLTSGYFGTLAIDMSYSDIHTPVDINGMTIHQYNIDNISKHYHGDNTNPARFNINGDEDYRQNVPLSSISL